MAKTTIVANPGFEVASRGERKPVIAWILDGSLEPVPVTPHGEVIDGVVLLKGRVIGTGKKFKAEKKKFKVVA